MKKMYIQIKVATLVALCCLSLWPATAEAQNSEKFVLVYYDEGRLDAFPQSAVASQGYANNQLCIKTVSDTAFYYNENRVDSVVVRSRNALSSRFASITQLKLNNKYNDQVYTDVIADIIGDSIITADIGAIGKWLTPSIQLSDETARVYVGRERVESKVSRRSYANDVYYTVAKPNQRLFTQTKVKDEVWSDAVGQYTETPVTLTATSFSSNLPGQSGEGFEQLIDNNAGTFFHSTWNVSDPTEKETIIATHPYLDITLPEQLRRIRFGYTTRNTGQYWPLSLTLSASNDGQNWTEIKTFTATNGQLPTAAGASFLSDVIDLGRNYRHLRLYLNQSSRRLYLVLAEFQLMKVEPNANPHESELIEPAEYRYQMEPFGRRYRVHFNWLTDHSENVPIVNIDVENGDVIASKVNYYNATITIDGGGVFPSMETTDMQIKGRGNSSWQQPQTYWYGDQSYTYGFYKNPYRIKFPSKHKPFGLTNGKNWVLLANKQAGSMMSNAIGMKAACLVGTIAANHIVPVELYLNGEYFGNYNFTEKVGLSNNSVELADETRATLLELDTYYDETYKFRSKQYNLPVNIKEPEFDEEDTETQLTMEMIQTEFNNFMDVVKGGQNLSDIVDIESLAKFLMLNELIMNHEIKHPKSTFLYNPEVASSTSKFYFGPVWDLDWAFGYETNRQYFTTDYSTDFYTSMTSMAGRRFIYDLRYVSNELDRAIYKVWRRFVKYQLEELIDFCDDYYAYARPSFERNANEAYWGDGLNYKATTENAKKWLRNRAQSVFSKLTAYDIPDDDAPIIDSFDDAGDNPGDTNGIDIKERQTLDENSLADVYDINGRLLKRGVSVFDLRTGLKPGIYIVNGKKMIIR